MLHVRSLSRITLLACMLYELLHVLSMRSIENVKEILPVRESILWKNIREVKHESSITLDEWPNILN